MGKNLGKPGNESEYMRENCTTDKPHVFSNTNVGYKLHLKEQSMAHFLYKVIKTIHWQSASSPALFVSGSVPVQNKVVVSSQMSVSIV